MSTIANQMNVNTQFRRGSATLNFGSTPSPETTVFVADTSGTILSSSQVSAWLEASVTSDNNDVEHLMGAAFLTVASGIPVAGTGFTIYADSQGGLATGAFTVQWSWR